MKWKIRVNLLYQLTKNNFMQTENLTDEQRNDLLRKQLWIDVYIANLKIRQSNMDIDFFSDLAVKRFDKTFSNYTAFTNSTLQ